MIYVDHTATTALHPDVLAAMMPYLTEQYGNPGSLYRAGQQAAGAVLHAREQTARCLGCQPREVYFTSGGTEADNQALLTAADWGARQGKRHLVCSAIEHAAVLRTAEHLAQNGFTVSLVDADAAGVVRPEAVEAALRPDTCAVSVMMVNNETGIVQPVDKIAALCRARGVLFHTDAVQAAGHLPVDFAGAGFDLLSLSAHKFYGPKGVGALLCRSGLRPAPLLRGGGQERGVRAGTENVPGIVGLGAALERACTGMAETAARVAALRVRLTEGLLRIPGAVLTGGADAPRAPGTVHICFEGLDRELLLVLLDCAGVCASAAATCSAGALERSHVLRSMGVSETLARGALRLSLGEENDKAQVDAIISAVRDAAARLRSEKEGAE